VYRSVVVILLFIVSQTSAFAEESYVASSMAVTDVLETCRRAGSNIMRADCAGYILGVYDQMSLLRLICPPNNPTGGSAQAVAVALKFLNEHPERWHQAPVYLVGQSFRTAFPCGTRRD
jgi:Rap1a immunity proteins